MYVRAMRDYAMLLEPTDPKAAAQWVVKAENVSANVMKHLRDSKRGQLKAHIYDLGVVCGDVWGSTRWACWNPVWSTSYSSLSPRIATNLNTSEIRGMSRNLRGFVKNCVRTFRS